VNGMFRKLRRQITLWVWLVLLALIAGTSAVIYYSTTTQISRRNAEMMAVFAESYYSEDDAGPGAAVPEQGSEAEADGAVSEQGSGKKQSGSAPAQGGEGLSAGGPRDNLAGVPPEEAGTSGSGLFYAVEFDADGAVCALINDATALHPNEEVTTTAQAVLAGTARTGTLDGFCYLKTTGSTSTGDISTLVVMMDNGIYDSNARVLLRNTLLFGTLALLLASWLSYVAAGRFVRPVREGYERQKQFISDAGHELKTPVSTISANAELLSREIGGNAWLDNIRYENRRMSDMIRQMLDLARCELRELPQEDVDLSYLVSAGILPFEAVCFERNLRVREEITPDIHISGNAAQLGQLISILIDNAVEYSAPQGEITVTLTQDRPAGPGSAHGAAGRETAARTRERGGRRNSALSAAGGQTAARTRKRAGAQAILSVSNEGEAITPEQRARIFDAFTRGDAARTERAGHYGLGLAIARAVVTAHGGRIDVTSEGGVNTFTAVLGPAKSTSAASRS